MHILLWIFAIMDFLTAMVLLFLNYDIFTWRSGLTHTFYMIAKGGYFFMNDGDLASIFDIVIGILLILVMMGLQANTIVWIAAIYLFQKAIFCFMRF